MIDSSVIGDSHNEHPFTIGRLDVDRGHVHVFDDTTLDVVMGKLDTITEFVAYLDKKERLLTSGRMVRAAGEEELLARYLAKMNERGEHDFMFGGNEDEGIVVFEGLWEEFLNSPERRAQVEADEISYAWDRLIETFASHLLAGTQYYATKPGNVAEQETALRFLAREPRTRRRMLARSLHELLAKPATSNFHARVIAHFGEGDPFYVFITLAHPHGMPEADYRDARLGALTRYMRVLKLTKPEARHIVGIATQPGLGVERSEDFGYLDGNEWTAADEEAAREDQRRTGFLTNVQAFAGTDYEYPVPRINQTEPANRAEPTLSRNASCPCGSGKRFKRCCGRDQFSKRRRKR